MEQVQAAYDRMRRPGFYQHILCDVGNIESCQVNWVKSPFLESQMPTLLMQDLSIVGMFAGPDLSAFGKPAGIDRGRVVGLAPGDRLVVQQVRPIRRGRQVPGRVPA